MIVFAADIGSIKSQRFGWCRLASSSASSLTGTDITAFAKHLADDLNAGESVALGFECPLFVPVTAEPVYLTSARPGEGNRSWSAGAGCGALATGLVEYTWIFERLREQVTHDIAVTLNWQDFQAQHAHLFIWEAFVTGIAKATSHHGDADIAARKFWSVCPDIEAANAVTAESPFSLIGAALLRTGLSQDIALLKQACVVVRA